METIEEMGVGLLDVVNKVLLTRWSENSLKIENKNKN